MWIGCVNLQLKSLVYCLFFFSGFSTACFADAPKCSTPPSELMVSVRTIRASSKISEIYSAGKSRFAANHDISLDPRLKDIVSKLQKLNYRTFKLIGSQAQKIPFGRRQTLNLVEGNTLTLRPQSVEDHRVGMWIRWEDSAGMQVIDTRMHFGIGESVITGLESSGDTGTILAIDVSASSN